MPLFCESAPLGVNTGLREQKWDARRAAMAGTARRGLNFTRRRRQQECRPGVEPVMCSMFATRAVRDDVPSAAFYSIGRAVRSVQQASHRYPPRALQYCPMLTLTTPSSFAAWGTRCKHRLAYFLGNLERAALLGWGRGTVFEAKACRPARPQTRRRSALDRLPPTTNRSRKAELR